MAEYRENIMGGPTEGGFNNIHIQRLTIASGVQVYAGMALYYTGTDMQVAPSDSSLAGDSIPAFAGIAAIDSPNVRVDRYWTDGTELGYIQTDDDDGNYRSPTDMSWSPLSGANVISVITQGVVEVWVASGASGTQVAGAKICQANGQTGTVFDGAVQIAGANDVASGSVIGTIVSGTDVDTASGTYTTVTTLPMAKVKVRLGP